MYIVTTSTIVALLMKSNKWFAIGLAAGALCGARTANRHKATVALNATLAHFTFDTMTIPPAQVTQKLAQSQRSLAQAQRMEPNKRRNAAWAMASNGQVDLQRPSDSDLDQFALALTQQLQDQTEQLEDQVYDMQVYRTLIPTGYFAAIGLLSYTAALTAFTVGYFALPRVAAAASGFAGGAAMGGGWMVLRILNPPTKVEE